MCNMYSMVSNKEAIRAFANFLRVAPEMDNLPAIPGIYANGWAPIVRATDDGNRELARVRWGLPTPPDKLAHVFEPFATDRPTRGAGLGLAICKELAEAAGFDLTLENQPAASGYGLVAHLKFSDLAARP